MATSASKIVVFPMLTVMYVSYSNFPLQHSFQWTFVRFIINVGIIRLSDQLDNSFPLSGGMIQDTVVSQNLTKNKQNHQS